LAVDYLRLSQYDYRKLFNVHAICQQALQLSERIKNNEQIAYSLNKIADNYAGMGDLRKALDYYFKAKKVYERYESGHMAIQDIAETYLRMHMPDSAYLSDGKKFLVSKTLGDIEEMLPKEIFTRIHHSTIVNINAVTHYIKTDGSYVVMNTNEKLMVSKARKEVLPERLGLK